MFGKRKRLNKEELEELKDLSRLVSYEEFKLNQASNNTAMIPNARQYINTQQGLVDVLRSVKSQVISFKLLEMGYPQGQPVTIDLKTGKIKKIEKSPVQQSAQPAQPVKENGNTKDKTSS